MKNRNSRRGKKQQIIAAVIVGILVLALVVSVLPSLFVIA